jgi:exopolyphosphatase/guanosine-5'-triphosphate,3'-diphosphate pyrophosphatase
VKFAAIDIGSNAIRLQLTKVLEFENRITFKKLEYIRFPLRLGHDVFSIGKIGSEKEEAFMKLMHAYKNMIDLYEIIHYYGCATSAMRESENGIDIVRRVQEEVGLELNIISGQREAEMINTVISLNLDNQTYIHIDVGGGSTELNFYRNQEKVLSESFNLGSVRRLEKNDSPQVWEAMQKWIQDQLKGNKGRIVAIGTGGNINKLYELSKVKSKRIMSINTLIKMQEYLKGTTLDDVIIPASEIYLSVMRFAGAKSIYVPDIGLKDGINYYLYDKYYPSKGKVLVRNS